MCRFILNKNKSHNNDEMQIKSRIVYYKTLNRKFNTLYYTKNHYPQDSE